MKLIDGELWPLASNSAFRKTDFVIRWRSPNYADPLASVVDQLNLPF